jgi:hypothetical protein
VQIRLQYGSGSGLRSGAINTEDQRLNGEGQLNNGGTKRNGPCVPDFACAARAARL